MLPTYLQSSYKQYKQDTDEVATWLVETARSLGYVSEQLAGDSQEKQAKPKKGKSKHKTRKQLRDAARSSARVRNQFTITIQEFLDLADHIAQRAKDAIRIPVSILHKLQRTIDARQECSLWFRVNENDKKTDENHDYFLDVLQQVSDLLEPFSSNLSKSAEPQTQKVDNLFAHLHIEEPSEKFIAQEPKAPAPAKTPAVEYKVETQHTKAEILFAGFSLFNDISQIQICVADIWQQYRKGLIDLITAAVTSNTSTQLVQRLEQQFFEQFPSVRDPEEVIETVYKVKCSLTGRAPTLFNNFDESTEEVARFTYLDLHVLLLSLMDVMSKDTIPISRPGFFGIYEPQADRSKMTFKQRFDEDKLILGELLPDFWMLAWNKNRTSWEDGLTTGFRKMLNSRKVHISTMFAARIFLDVHHLLRSAVGVPFHQLQALGKHIKESWALTTQMRDPSQTRNWSSGNDRAVQGDLIDMIDEWLESDAIGLRIAKLVRGQVPVPKGSFRLFRQHPLMCGLLAFYLHCQAHHAGVLYANAMGAVLYSSHLYNAVLQEGYCNATWADMESLINIQSEEHLFVGGKPKTPEDYFKRFCLCSGYSAEQFAAKRRQGGHVAAARGPRTLEMKGDLSQIINDHLFKNTEDYLEPIEDFINARYTVENEVEEDGGNEIPVTVTTVIKPRTKDEIRSYLRHRLPKQAKASPVELLLAVQAILSSEVPMLAFDYFHLHRTCEMMLDMLQKTLHDCFLKYFQAGYLETKAQLPFVVGYIFMVASGSQRLVTQLGLRNPDKGDEVSSELLSLAGGVLQMLLTDGNFGPHSQEAASYAMGPGTLHLQQYRGPREQSWPELRLQEALPQ